MIAAMHILLLIHSPLVVAQGSASSCTDETCSMAEETSSAKVWIANDLANDSALEQDAEHTMTLLQTLTMIQNESDAISMLPEHHNNSSPFHKESIVSLLDNSPLCPDGLAGILSVTATVGTFSLLLFVILTATVVWYAISFPSGFETVKGVETEKGSSSATETEKGPSSHTEFSPKVVETEKVPSSTSSMSSTHEAPIWLNRISLICACLIMINYTVVMPGAGEVADEHDAGMIFSGFIIGIYSIGSCVSIPFMYYLSKRSYRLAFVAVGVFGSAGNIMYASAAKVDWGPMLLLARFICGLEGGAAVVCGSALQKCNGAALIPMLIARLTMAGSAGLILGPTISSLVRSLLPQFSPEVVPAAAMGICTVLFLIIVCIKMPSQSECIAGVDEDHKSKSLTEQASPEFIGASYLALNLCVIYSVVRFFQRVYWESALLVILSIEYGYGDVASGYQLSLALLPLLATPLFARFYARLGFHKFMFATEAMQLAGLVLMIRIGEPSTFSFLILIIGSGLFNFANWTQNIAYSILLKRFDIPNHWLLCIDGRVSVMYFFTYFGYFFGPVFSRSMTDVCLWQNLLPYGLFLLFAQMVVSTLLVMHYMRSYFNKL